MFDDVLNFQRDSEALWRGKKCLISRQGFTVLRMSMNQNTFSPLFAMTQACLILFVVHEPFGRE